MIPRLLHQLWLGPKPLPTREREWVTQMARLNPTWKHKLHGNELLSRYARDPYVSWLEKEANSNPKEWAFVADRLRVLLLRDEGGVYLDADCEPIQPLDSVFHRIPASVEFVAALRSPNRKSVALRGGVPIVDNTFMASAKQGRMIHRVCALWSSTLRKVNGQETGMFILDNADPSTLLLGHRYFYAEQRYPETVVLHDAHNLGSWSNHATKPH